MVDGEPMYLDGLVHRAAPDFFRMGDREGIIMGGCGMDMGFHLVYSLSSILYRNGYRCLGKGCPSNDHANDHGAFSRAYDEEHAAGEPRWLTADGLYSSEGRTPEEIEQQRAYREAKDAAWHASERARYSRRRVHSDGGYALQHRWM
jgi:hypothetical protein